MNLIPQRWTRHAAMHAAASCAAILDRPAFPRPAFLRPALPRPALAPAALVLAALLPALAGCGAMHAQSQSDANRPSLKAARVALAEGEAATALQIAHGVLSMEPHDVAAMIAAGDADIALGNRRAAEKDYKQALAVQPDSVPAQIGLAKLTMRDDAKLAEAMFRHILANSPHDAAALTDLGVALDLQDRHKEAQAAYAQAIAVNGDLTSTRVDLALSLALSGDPVKAEGMLRDATEAGPVPAKVRADYALAEVMAGHSDQATDTLRADLSPDEAKASVEGMSALLPPAK
jgi:Flp pilus assembly protein TadD